MLRKILKHPNESFLRRWLDHEIASCLQKDGSGTLKASITWVLLSARTMTTSELAGAVDATMLRDYTLDAYTQLRRFNSNNIVPEAMQGLAFLFEVVPIDNDQGYMQVRHKVIWKLLDGRIRAQLFPSKRSAFGLFRKFFSERSDLPTVGLDVEAEQKLARVCINYMKLSQSQPVDCELRLNDSSFYKYAFENWAHHVARG